MILVRCFEVTRKCLGGVADGSFYNPGGRGLGLGSEQGSCLVFGDSQTASELSQGAVRRARSARKDVPQRVASQPARFGDGFQVGGYPQRGSGNE